MNEFRSCATCRWYDHEYDNCNRYPKCTGVARDHWCGEWAEAEVTDEHTFFAGGVPAYKVTERENGTSTTEPVPDEEREQYLEDMMHTVAETTFEFDGELTIVGIESTFPVRIFNCPTKPGVVEIHVGGKVRRYVEEDK